TNAGIARKLGIAPNTASKWRKRYATQGVDGLRDRKRPGRPRVFAAPIMAEVKAIACELPVTRGVPISRWSLQESSWARTPTLADENGAGRPVTSAQLGVVSPIKSRTQEPRAPRTVATSTHLRFCMMRLLRAAALSPIPGEGAAMELLIECCAGLDVHKASVTATVRVPDQVGGRLQQTRSFRATTAGLVLLGDWLASFGVTVVGMESTGVYWRPVYYLLEDDFQCWLLNAAHLRTVPGRKTDVADSVWICQLVEHGLVRPSFVPPKPIRELRDLTRYRKALIQERTREAQRLQKVLEDAGIKLGTVASDVLGVSGRAMLDALVSGTHDPAVLAELAKGRLRAKLPALREAL